MRQSIVTTSRPSRRTVVTFLRISSTGSGGRTSGRSPALLYRLLVTPLHVAQSPAGFGRGLNELGGQPISIGHNNCHGVLNPPHLIVHMSDCCVNIISFLFDTLQPFLKNGSKICCSSHGHRSAPWRITSSYTSGSISIRTLNLGISVGLLACSEKGVKLPVEK